MDYVIGCDVGSQSTKAMLVAFDGTLVGEASADYAIDYPQPLWAEQPVARWIEALTVAIRRLLAENGLTGGSGAARVRALALATQVDGVVAMDRAGQVLHPALIWMDRRAGVECAAARTVMDDQELFARTGLNLDASHVAPKIRWLIDHQPAIAAQAAHFLLPGSYLAYYLSGELAVDYSNASSTLLLDVRTKSWSPALCRLFDIGVERLAPVGAATARLGKMRPAVARALGLHADISVMVGCGDEHAACLGAGIVAAGLVGDIAGTAEPVCTVAATPVFDPTRLVETHCHADPELWLLENPGFVSGANLRWFCDQLAGKAGGAGRTRYQVLDQEAAAVAPGAEGLVFLPCLMGAMAPTWNEAARGAFCGFTLAHTRGHFVRAILEGTAYAVRDCTDQMRAIGLHLAEMRVMGGGARSRLWNQLKADVTGLPVAVPKTIETTALGAAMLALVGGGAFGSLTEASQRVVQVQELYEPQPANYQAYAEAYGRYRDAYFTLLPYFERNKLHPPSSKAFPKNE